MKKSGSKKRKTGTKGKKSTRKSAGSVYIGGMKFDIKEITKKLSPYLSKTDKVFETAGEKTDATTKEIVKYVKSHPLESVSIAFLAGFFLASLKK